MITPAEVIEIETDEISVYWSTEDSTEYDLSTDELDVETDEIYVYYVPRGVNR